TILLLVNKVDKMKNKGGEKNNPFLCENSYDNFPSFSKVFDKQQNHDDDNELSIDTYAVAKPVDISVEQQLSNNEEKSFVQSDENEQTNSELSIDASKLRSPPEQEFKKTTCDVGVQTQ